MRRGIIIAIRDSLVPRRFPVWSSEEGSDPAAAGPNQHPPKDPAKLIVREMPEETSRASKIKPEEYSCEGAEDQAADKSNGDCEEEIWPFAELLGSFERHRMI